ncbi:MAG: putative mucin/carbohydrate-binding domain-containing protein, partial [Sarcina sp.]
GYPIYTATLNSNANPLAFVRALNTILFKEDNIIKITCDTGALNKVSISNFPNEGDIHLFSTETEYYKVTKNGLVTFIPQSILANNKISVRKASNIYQDAFTLTFDPNSMLIKATAVDVSINNGGVWQTATAFQYTFKDRNGETIKTDYIYAADPGIVGRNGSLVTLANSLNNTPFSYGQSIEFYAPYKYYSVINKTFMSIANMPFSSNEYWKFNDTETVTITPLGLVLSSNSPLGNTPFLQNIIILNDDNDKSTVQIYFDISSNKLLISTSSFNIGKISPSGDGNYFIFTLKDSSGNQKAISIIKEKVKPDEFVAALNNHSFEFGDTITMECPDLKKISIQNYPKYKSNYSPLVKTEKFTITKLGLVSSLKLLKNEISFLGDANNLIAKIYFSLNGNKLIVKSTGITANTDFGDNEYFAIVLKDTSGNTIKEASVKGNENANAFVTALNGISFQENYSIIARFKEKDKFLIS